MELTHLLLIRHAEVEPRYQRVFGGRIDMDLSDTGRAQAAQLARFLQRWKLSAVYTSPMRRVRETLAPLLVNGTPAPTVLPELREVDFGDWTGHGWEEIQTRFKVSAYNWLDELDRGAIPGAESAAALRARLQPCVDRLLREHAGGTVAVYCHGGVVRALLALLLDLPLRKFAGFEVDYASVTEVEIGERGAEVQLLNFAPWRYLPA
jgi:broad specificity phosphatase PhoE